MLRISNDVFSLVDIRDIISFYVLHELIHWGRFLLVTGHF